ncbi:alginate export family protein [Limnoglobus roseus]|uniref:hypothetical protein n=1 Tax=Limnoglobus roseus TaxID=2598579 RepID=UPI0011EA9440|nr:hypothetical protein [Limnoglobus roseus]
MPRTTPAPIGVGSPLLAEPSQRTDADPSVQFPSSVRQPPPAVSIGQPLSTPYDWNQFRLGGQFRIEGDANNFPFHPTSLLPEQPSRAFVNQRYRLWLTYSPNEHVEGYAQMQVGGINWGTNYDFNKNFIGNFTSVVGDRVGIELRRAWLAYKDEDLGKVRVGFLDWHDSFNDTLASSNYDFNVAGIDWVRVAPALNGLRLSAATLLLSDQAFATSNPAPSAGTHSAVLYAFDADQPLTDKFSVGASAYVLYDRGGYSFPTVAAYRYSVESWFGLRAKWDSETLPLAGFVLANTGRRADFGPTGFRNTGWASWLQAGPLKIGEGKLSTQILYASGDSDPGNGRSGEFRTVAQSYRDNFGAQGYWSYLQLTSPNGPGDVADLGVSLQNRGLGLLTAQGKFEYPLAKRLLSTTTAGCLQSAVRNPANGSRDIGTEIGEMFTIDFGGGMKLDTGSAVLFTGDFYRPAPNAAKEATLWEVFGRLQLEF